MRDRKSIAIVSFLILFIISLSMINIVHADCKITNVRWGGPVNPPQTLYTTITNTNGKEGRHVDVTVAYWYPLGPYWVNVTAPGGKLTTRTYWVPAGESVTDKAVFANSIQTWKVDTIDYPTGETDEWRSDDFGATWKDKSGTIHKAQIVGGIIVPVDKFGLLAPYIGLASTILVATVATAVYVKRVKRRKEKQ
jgi:hypothetical protein